MEVLRDAFQGIVLSYEPFPIDFDVVWHWIGYSKKQDALISLQKNFIEDIDFLRSNVKTSSPRGGRPLIKIIISIDCFKAFCMLAQTERGKEVRRYFIEIEKQYRHQQHDVKPGQQLSHIESQVTYYSSLVESLDCQIIELTEKQNQARELAQLYQNIKTKLVSPLPMSLPPTTMQSSFIQIVQSLIEKKQINEDSDYQVLFLSSIMMSDKVTITLATGAESTGKQILLLNFAPVYKAYVAECLAGKAIDQQSLRNWIDQHPACYGLTYKRKFGRVSTRGYAFDLEKLNDLHKINIS
nr:hypothetical protein [uncultured Arsenicibacter sp.]